MKRLFIILNMLAVLAAISLSCTNVEFDNILDPESSNYVGDEAAAGDTIANIYNPEHPLYNDQLRDKEPPELTITIGSPVQLTVGDSKRLEELKSKVSVKDESDVSVHADISNVNTLVEGNYWIIFTAQDSWGNETVDSLEVVVVKEAIKDTIPPNIYLKGKPYIEITVGQKFIDEGAWATDDPSKDDLTSRIEVSGSVDTSTPGTYVITYTVEDDAGYTASVERTVEVVSEGPSVTMPTIELNGRADTSFDMGGIYVEYGATAEDSDGPIPTEEITIKYPSGFEPGVPIDESGKYRVTYEAVNEAGTQTAFRTVTVLSDECQFDPDPPVITLDGDLEINHPIGTDWEDPGYYAEDDLDGPVDVIVENEPDVNTAGDYIIKYRAMDMCGNVDSAQRIVHVLAGPAITINGNNPDTISVRIEYDDEGATCDFPIDVESDVDPTTPGDYTITYSATNTEGITSSVERKVVVIPGSSGDDLMLKYGVPRDEGFNSLAANVDLSTENGSGIAPEMNGRKLSFSFGQGGFYDIRFGDPDLDLKSKVSHTLDQPQPTITFTETGVARLDGTYYVNYVDGVLYLVEESGAFAIIGE